MRSSPNNKPCTYGHPRFGWPSAATPSALLPVPLQGLRDPFIADNVEGPVGAYVAGLAANVLATTQVWLDGANPPIRDRETNVGTSSPMP